MAWELGWATAWGPAAEPRRRPVAVSRMPGLCAHFSSLLRRLPANPGYLPTFFRSSSQMEKTPGFSSQVSSHSTISSFAARSPAVSFGRRSAKRAWSFAVIAARRQARARRTSPAAVAWAYSRSMSSSVRSRFSNPSWRMPQTSGASGTPVSRSRRRRVASLTGASVHSSSPKSASVMRSGRLASRKAANASRLLFLPADATPILLDSAGVVRQFLGELVAAGAIGARHKIEVVRGRGLDRGSQRSHARIGDGAGRQARVLVGVVGLVAREVRTVDDAVVAVFDLGGVDGGRIALQGHADPQAVRKDRGDERPLVRQLGLALDQRGERHDLVRFRGRRAQGGPGLAEAIGHQAAELGRRGVARYVIGVGEEVAFERRRLRVEVADRQRIAGRREEPRAVHDLQSLERLRDVEGAVAFGHHQHIEEDVAAHDAVEDLPHALAVLEHVLAGLEPGAGAEGADHQELQAVFDDAAVGQDARDLARVGAAGDDDEALPRRAYARRQD